MLRSPRRPFTRHSFSQYLLAHRLLALVLLLWLAGCAGGGCGGGGCSCAGVTPLAEGFDVERRIENSATARITDAGFNFLESNMGALATQMLGDSVLTFEIPTSNSTLVDVCPDGPKPNATPPECIAEIDVAGLDLTSNAAYGLIPGAPHRLRLRGKLPLRVKKLPLAIAGPDVFLTVTGNNQCSGNQSFANIELTIDMSIEIDQDPTHSRFGYTRMRVENVVIDENDVENSLKFCDGFITAALLNLIKPLLIGQLVDPLVKTVKTQINSQMCQQANPDLSPPCPSGTQNVEGVCRYGNSPDAACASVILGSDGNIDIGSMFASLSPGAKGGFDFVFAGGGEGLRTDGSGYHWGDLNPVDNGASLGLYGGTEPTPITGCVPLANVALPSGIPFPDELLANTVSGWPAGEQPHFGLGINERFTNYMLAQTYNSGALCLGITADALGAGVPLTTALVGVGLGASSMTELGRQKQAAELAIVMRPQTPPHMTFGNGTDIATDPSVRLTMDQLSLDFYVWSLNRFIRVMTTTLDVDIPMNIIVTPQGLQPAIDKIAVANATVTNASLLREDPSKIAAALQDLLGSLLGSALGDALPPINISDQLSGLGLTLNIPPSVEGKGSPGLRKLVKGNDNYLGIFASFGLANAQNAAAPLRSATKAELVSLEVDPEGLRLGSYRRDNGPRATLLAGSSLDDGNHLIEWQYKLDTGPWHPFTRERYLTVTDPWLRAEGRHTAYVRSRIVGQVNSLDPEPVAVTLLIDGGAPTLRVDQDSDGLVVVRAGDVVSGNKTQVRVRLGHLNSGGEMRFDAWSQWQDADAVLPFDPNDADEIEVEARDQDEHVTTVSQPLRGRDAATGAGCQCALVKTPSAAAPKRGLAWLIAGLLAMAVVVRRRRRSTPAVVARRRWARTVAAATVIVAASTASGCSCSGDADNGIASCRKRGDCQVLAPGLVGAYTSAAVAADNTIWVAGYLEANWQDSLQYGDLVVGRYDGERVLWKVVDGWDPEEVVDEERYDPQGFRGGRVDPAYDVGLWTSIALDGAGHPAVAYYDATLRALRYASFDGEQWSTTIVQQLPNADLGRHAKLLLVGGTPQIAFHFREPGEGGHVTSGVRLARGSSVSAGDAHWSFEDVATDTTTPCRAFLCAAGSACVIDSGVCADKSKDCNPACGTSDECVMLAGNPTCAAVYDANKTENYPDALGLFISAALRPDGSVGLAYYDRIHGDLVVAHKEGDSWQQIIADGEAGDAGIGASLAIDAQGNYHLAYVNGLDEALNYTMVEGGSTPGAVEIVDDGLGHADGHHLVGDDAHIFVTQSGEIRISYQDATDGTLNYAIGTPAGGAHNWSSKVLAQDDFAGFFSSQIEVKGQLKVLNWWRRAAPSARGDVRLLSP